MGHMRSDNLPAEVTSFVDRAQDRARIEELLGRARLVTLIGVGGVGKTRLALRVAADAKAEYPDGVWLAELSAVEDPGLLPHTVSAAIGVDDQSARDQLDVLAAFVAEKRILLLLDTCERQLDATADLAERLLREAPHLRILATSRVPLRAPGEHLYTVDPLATEAADAMSSDAALLFIDRALAVAPSVELGPEVVQLCRRLDGLPLAIELAAVRLRGLSLEQLSRRLDDRFDVLVGAGRTTGPPRHETMRTAIGWSHELCNPQERLLWARLSVFAGSFDLAAADAVGADERLMPSRALPGLVEKSIVLRDGDRYRLLDTVREYGAEWLKTLGETEAIRTRHRDYFLGMAMAFEAQWWGPRQVEWNERLRANHTNIRAAIEFSYARPAEQATGLELAALLVYYWFSHGQFKEGRYHLEQGLSLCTEASPQRTRALWCCAWLAGLQGEPEVTDRYGAECREAARAQGDGVSLAWGVAMAAVHGVAVGDHGEAIRAARESADLFALAGGDGLGRTYMRLAQGLGLMGAGQPVEGLALISEGYTHCVEHGEMWLRGYAALFRGMTELSLGDATAAAASAREGGRIKWALGDNLGTAEAIDLLAEALCVQGHAEWAARLLGVGDAAWLTIGVPQAGIPLLTGPRQECERSCRDRLGDRAYERAYDEGRAVDLPGGIERVLVEEAFDGPSA